MAGAMATFSRPCGAVGLLRLFLLIPLLLVFVLRPLGFPLALAGLAVAGALDLALDRVALELALVLLGHRDAVEIAVDRERQLPILCHRAILDPRVVALAA